MLLIHGDRDEVVPISHSKKLRGSRKHYKVPCDMHLQKGSTHNVFDLHGDVIDPIMAFLR